MQTHSKSIQQMMGSECRKMLCGLNKKSCARLYCIGIRKKAAFKAAYLI